jgi:hypothetical protein
MPAYGHVKVVVFWGIIDMLRPINICRLSVAVMFSSMALLPNAIAADNAKATQYYSLYDDGGEHAASACDTRNKLPKKLSKTRLKTKLNSYLGSEQIEFSEKNEASIDAFEHYFSNAADCKVAVKQLQKEYGY